MKMIKYLGHFKKLPGNMISNSMEIREILFSNFKLQILQNLSRIIFSNMV